MTNYERIKQMSVEEMTDFITDVYHEGYLDGQRDSLYGTMYDREWLESEAEE